MQQRLELTAYLVIVIFSAVNCHGGKSQPDVQIHNFTAEAAPVSTREYHTSSGKHFILTVDHSMGASLNEVTLMTRGFEMVDDSFRLGVIDPIEQVIITDLDNNGYEEIYLTTRSAGSGSTSDIHGFSSNRDRSVSTIHIHRPDNSSPQMEGFFGHNVYRIDSGHLVNRFPIYRDSDTMSSPSGGFREIFYRLIAGEAGWQLVLDAEGSNTKTD